MGKNIGTALLHGALAGIQGGAASKAMSLREEAKEARARSMESLKQGGRMDLQKDQQGFLKGESELGRELTRDQIASTEKLTTAQIDSNESMKAAQLNLQQMIAQLNEGGRNARQTAQLQSQIEQQQKTIDAAMERLGVQGEQALENISAQGEVQGTLKDQQGDIDKEKIELSGAQSRETLAAKYGQEIALHNSKLAANADAEAAAEATRMAEFKETDAYKTATEPMKKYMELQVLVNKKVDFSDLAKSPGAYKGEALKGATAKQMELAMTQLEKDPSFNRMDPWQQWNMAQAKATLLANPTLKVTVGTKAVPEDKLVATAKAWNEGTISPVQVMMMTPTSLAEVMDIAQEIKPKGTVRNAPPYSGSGVNPEAGVLAGGGTALNRPKVEAKGVPGRQASEWLWTMLGGGDPTKMTEGDTEVSEAQKEGVLNLPNL